MHRAKDREKREEKKRKDVREKKLSSRTKPIQSLYIHQAKSKSSTTCTCRSGAKSDEINGGEAIVFLR
jgi:hypothetical protein